jgi:diaminopimelate decarboxylase
MGAVEIGDLLVVEGAGAYCAGMSSKNYNSFPEAPEVMKGSDGTMHLVRQKQTLEQILVNELELPDDAC